MLIGFLANYRTSYNEKLYFLFVLLGDYNVKLVGRSNS